MAVPAAWSPPPALALAAALALAIAALLLFRARTRRPGATFEYPPIAPAPRALADTPPIPYRPFRWGAYHVTMGIRPMPWDDWIELDRDFAAYHRIRAARLAARGADVLRVLPARAGVPGGAAGALELVHELAEYLARRYPGDFRVTRRRWGRGGWGGAPAVDTISVGPVGATYRLPRGAGARAAARALEIAALLVQDDLAVMVEGADGQYYFQAGAICVAGFWRMRDKLGLALDAIHVSGDVPQYAEKLQTGMGRFFRRLAVGRPVVRNNYFVQVVGGAGDDGDGDELAWSATTNGPEDAYPAGRAAAQAARAGTVRAEAVRLRSERQTLRRLPRSGAVVFTIRTYLTPLPALAREAGVAGRLAAAVRSWPADVAAYKGAGLYRDAMLAYLDARADGGGAGGGGGGGAAAGYPY